MAATFRDLADRQHGRSTATRDLRPAVEVVVACPTCTAPLDIDEAAEAGDARRPARVAFCSGCEFAIEFLTTDD